MKHTILAAAFSVIVTPVLADPVLGVYQTEAGDAGNYAHVEMYKCDDAICGVIRKAFNGAGQQIESDTVGKRMIWDMQAQGSGTYGKGKIWAPDRNKTYRSKMTLSGNVLEVSGCVLGICRGQTWSRVQ